MANNVSIAIIGCYYGKFPVWIQYWLKSCADNNTIDYYIVTDISINDIPQNVHIVSLSLNEVKELAERKMGIHVELKRPYKLCDLRPCYGLVFEDYLKDYDYWGHCDFDLIWGDVRGFIEKYDLTQYDKFLPFGHLSLYRNTAEISRRFMMDGSECGDYKEVFATGEGHAFDETDGIYEIYRKHGFPMFEKRIFAEIKTFHHRFRLKFVDKNFKHQVFYYENGKVIRAYEQKGECKKQNFIYVHFRRKLPADNRKWNEIGNFYITNTGFYDKGNENVDAEIMEMYNYNPGMLAEFGETVSFVMKNIGKIRTKIENEIITIRQKR